MHKWCGLLDRRAVLWLVRLHGTHQRGYQMVATFYHILGATFGRKKTWRIELTLAIIIERSGIFDSTDIDHFKPMFPMMSNALCHHRHVQFQIVLQKKIEATLILKLTDWNRNLTKSPSPKHKQAYKKVEQNHRSAYKIIVQKVVHKIEQKFIKKLSKKSQNIHPKKLTTRHVLQLASFMSGLIQFFPICSKDAKTCKSNL